MRKRGNMKKRPDIKVNGKQHQTHELKSRGISHVGNPVSKKRKSNQNSDRKKGFKYRNIGTVTDTPTI